MRIAVAEKQLGRLETARVDSLSYRLQLALDGLDTTHAREAAYFALYVLDKPELAMERALANWNVQHEPIDARLVLEAALAAHQAGQREIRHVGAGDQQDESRGAEEEEQGRAGAATFRGDHFLVPVQLEDGPAVEVTVRADVPAEGDAVSVALDRSAVVLTDR